MRRALLEAGIGAKPLGRDGRMRSTTSANAGLLGRAVVSLMHMGCAPPGAAPGAGESQTGPRAFLHQAALALRQGRQEMADLTFRTLFRISAAIVETPPAAEEER
jgi:hypothetical protein